MMLGRMLLDILATYDDEMKSIEKEVARRRKGAIALKNQNLGDLLFVLTDDDKRSYRICQKVDDKVMIIVVGQTLSGAVGRLFAILEDYMSNHDERPSSPLGQLQFMCGDTEYWVEPDAYQDKTT